MTHNDAVTTHHQLVLILLASSFSPIFCSAALNTLHEGTTFCEISLQSSKVIIVDLNISKDIEPFIPTCVRVYYCEYIEQLTKFATILM